MTRKSYRLVFVFVFLVSVLAGVAHAWLERAHAREDLRARLRSLGLGLQGAVSVQLARGRSDRLARLLREFGEQERLASAVVCGGGKAVAFDSRASAEASGLCADAAVIRSELSGEAEERLVAIGGRQHFLLARPIPWDGPADPSGKTPRSLVLAHSLSVVEARASSAFFRALATALITGVAAFLLLRGLTHWVLNRSLRYLVRWTRILFSGGRGGPSASRIREVDRRLPEEFRELTKELTSLALKLRHERLRLVAAQDVDSRAGLGLKVREVLRGRRLVIVANREPYSHERRDGSVEVVRPASGVVTALEPIMRLCGGGIWVGHGSGGADREVVDERDEIRVPPENPTYTLRRVWLTSEEERGYYYGFANEGLWPLCHLAYTRPTFRITDWETYKAVNQKFAEATLRGIDAAGSVILVQDYHYALLPKMLRDRAPDASIELFWHIPWPNPEAFGICPQYHELLEGMLGADVVGFHTQFHCNNFLETCDRYLEARVDWERFSVTVGNRETLVRSYPISIATEPVPRLTRERRNELRRRYGISTPLVALGVDRLDYTKGLVERIAGVERFLEKYPQYVGEFTFVEMGTPSRTNIASYRVLIREVEAAIARVNRRFPYGPIVFLKGHFDWGDVAEFYQLGRVCLVTSLHDGMNLVAKEYVWSQAADEGALILSRFTGAARELSEALIVNPYSSEEIADALHEALGWSREERRRRMQRMKEKVQGHNAFHWATDLLAGVNAKA